MAIVNCPYCSAPVDIGNRTGLLDLRCTACESDFQAGIPEPAPPAGAPAPTPGMPKPVATLFDDGHWTTYKEPLTQ